MPSYPMEFVSEAKANHSFELPWAISSGDMNTLCSVPINFGGVGGGFSPEDLFLQAVMNCFVGTFKVMAKLSKMTFTNMQVSGKLYVDKNQEGKVCMKTIHLAIAILGADRPERLENLVSKALRDGFIINSVKSEILYSLNEGTIVTIH
jgi:organic hydroperoxide reductase OsmC/OhrA